MKAVIEIALRGSVFSVARKQLKAAEASPKYGPTTTWALNQLEPCFQN